MGEVDYMQIDSLQRQVNAHSASISSAQSRITTIDEKLERLRTAKKSVGEIQKRFMISGILSTTAISSRNGKASKKMPLSSSGRPSPPSTQLSKRRWIPSMMISVMKSLD